MRAPPDRVAKDTKHLGVALDHSTSKLAEARKQAESKDSYLTLKQFDFIYDRIQTARKSLKAQQEVIDKMETKMIAVIDKRNEKEEKKAQEMRLVGEDKNI